MRSRTVYMVRAPHLERVVVWLEKPSPGLRAHLRYSIAIKTAERDTPGAEHQNAVQDMTTAGRMWPRQEKCGKPCAGQTGQSMNKQGLNDSARASTLGFLGHIEVLTAVP